uniref:non-specific serine/threonine protein kinase n=2 Tax=Mesocestoides corti TaxID=53468 RepID=A0A5K3EXC5_MESCO
MQPSVNTPVGIKERLISLENALANPFSDLSIERILDVFINAVLDGRKLTKDKQDTQILAFSERFTEPVKKLLTLRRQRHDFSFIASLGRGAYGRVDLVRENATGQTYAMKTLDKSKMLSQQADFWAEREIMSQSASPWIVHLFYSFQDARSLYMVMEYVPGGTLVCWMDEVELISETVCRFYAAEITQALSDLHSMGFIHRDIKPDNLLLDVSGHLKLIDFGTCVRVDPISHRVRCESAVGTPDYISPEVLYSQSSGGGEYGFPVDWWALGVLVYEMIYGETPFYSDDLVTTYSKIMSHTTSFHLPKDITITPSCLDFIKRLLSPEEVRLGSGTGGADDVRNHPWFAPTWSTTECLPGRVNEPGDEAFFDWTWKTLRSITPGPFHPILTSETDTSYFHDEEETESLEVESGIGTDKNGGDNGSYDDKFEGSQLSFAGFTFSSPNLAPLSSIYSDPVQPQTEVCDASLVDGLEKREVGDGRCSTANSLRIRELEESLARSELQLATAEARFAENLRDAERRVEVARLELASATSLMEAEIAKWKAIAESEHKARQTAEAQKAKAADLLAKRATDMADRLTAGGSITRASVERRQASLPVDMPPDAGDLVPLPATGVTSPHETDPSSSPATELLLKRIQELVERAQQADELLEIERRFSELYKKACEEKEDQLGERDQQITSLNEALEAAKQSMEQSQLAARHALMEEQERSAQYLECLKAEEKSSEAANRRAQIASNEANALREEVQKLREGLSKAQEDFATEKLKCGAAVNKIQQLTCSSLLLWDADKSTEILQQSSTADSSSPSDVNLLSPSTSTLSRKISRQGPSLLLDLPLSAILHVRSVTSCDVLHAPADDLPRIFQVIFDQCEVGGGVRQAALPSAQLPEPRKSSPESSPHCVTPPPKSAPATGILGVSKTLPRKLSFSFSGAFSIASKSSSPLAVAAASPLKVRTNSSGQLLSTACSSDPLFRNLPVPLTLGTSPIPLQGHMLQRIHFRVPAVCELCKRACWHVLSPPPALQCLHCQMKLHLSHLEKRDYILRPCGKSTAILIFRAPCEQIKRSWLNYLLSAIGGGVASTGPGSPLQLTNVPTATTNSYESSTTSSISLCSPVGPPGATHESRPQSLAGAGASSIRSATLPYPSRVTLSSPETTSSPTKLTKEEKEEEEEIFVEPPSPIRDGPSSPKNATPPPTEDPVSETEQHAVVEL